MAAARRIDLETQSFRDGGWQVGPGRDLNGATLGIIGLGRLGSLVAGYGKAFGMNAIAWSQNLTAEKAAAQGVTAVSKAALFREADFITIHLRLSERSRGLDRQSVVSGTRVSVRVDLGGRRSIKKTKNISSQT